MLRRKATNLVGFLSVFNTFVQILDRFGSINSCISMSRSQSTQCCEIERSSNQQKSEYVNQPINKIGNLPQLTNSLSYVVPYFPTYLEIIFQMLNHQRHIPQLLVGQCQPMIDISLRLDISTRYSFVEASF